MERRGEPMSNKKKESNERPKQEVTIEMIGRLNEQYRSLYNISVEQNKRIDRLVKLSEETANFLLILGKGDDCVQRYGTESREQYQKLLDLTIGDGNEER